MNMTEDQLMAAMSMKNRHSRNFLMCLDPQASNFDHLVASLRRVARVSGRGIRIRGRLGKNNPHRHLYAVGGSLYRSSSQDIRIEHSVRVDIYLK
jgi:hypothetical protein